MLRRLPPGPARDATAAGALAVALVVGGIVIGLVVNARQPVPTPVTPSDVALGALLTLLGCGAIALRRVVPRLALVGATAAVLATVALSLGSLAPGISVLVSAYTVATLMPLRRSGVTYVGCVLAHAVGGILLTRAGGDVTPLLTYWRVPGDDLDAVAIASTATYVIPLLVGSNVRNRRAYTAELLARARRLENEREERDRQAATAERSRIARELHDIAAHDLSAIVVQAGAADRLVDRDPEAAKTTLRGIRKQGRETLSALRQLVGLLRDGDVAGRAPQPTLARVEELVVHGRTAGMAIELVATGTPIEVSTVADVAAYRVVQEALANARQHAPGSAVTVRVAYGDGVTIVVHNTNGTAVSGRASGRIDAGHGLAGMQERVQQAGGDVVVGPGADGGWLVQVWLPPAGPVR